MASSIKGLSKDIQCFDNVGMPGDQTISGIISDVSFDEKTGLTSFMLGSSKLQVIGLNLPEGVLIDGQDITIGFGDFATITINRKSNES